MATALSDAQLNELLATSSGWVWDAELGRLATVIEFSSFTEAIDFTSVIRDLALGINHFPEIYIFEEKKVQISIHTPNMDRPSDLDAQLIKEIDNLFSDQIAAQQVQAQQEVSNLSQPYIQAAPEISPQQLQTEQPYSPVAQQQQASQPLEMAQAPSVSPSYTPQPSDAAIAQTSSVASTETLQANLAQTALPNQGLQAAQQIPTNTPSSQPNPSSLPPLPPNVQ